MKKILTILVLLPNLAFAQVVKHGSIKSIADSLTEFLSKLVMPMLFTIALSFFVWGIVDFIRSSENSEARKKGKQRMLWGIIGLFAMVTFIGLTAILTETVFGADPILPQLFKN